MVSFKSRSDFAKIGNVCKCRKFCIFQDKTSLPLSFRQSQSPAKPAFPPHTKKDTAIGCLFNQNGGQSGIRTHGTLWGYTRFPIVHLRPLGHLSVAPLCITFFYIWQALFSFVRKKSRRKFKLQSTSNFQDTR